MLPYLFTNLDFSGLFRFVSPSFFKVISPAALFKIAPQLRKNYLDEKAWKKLRGQSERRLRKAGFAPEKVPGDHALRLFFYQILTSESWILDFRSEAFAREAGKEPAWDPKPLY